MTTFLTQSLVKLIVKTGHFFKRVPVFFIPKKRVFIDHVQQINFVNQMTDATDKIDYS